MKYDFSQFNEVHGNDTPTSNNTDGLLAELDSVNPFTATVDPSAKMEPEVLDLQPQKIDFGTAKTENTSETFGEMASKLGLDVSVKEDNIIPFDSEDDMNKTINIENMAKRIEELKLLAKQLESVKEVYPNEITNVDIPIAPMPELEGNGLGQAMPMGGPQKTLIPPTGYANYSSEPPVEENNHNSFMAAFVNCSVLGFITAAIGSGFIFYLLNHI